MFVVRKDGTTSDILVQTSDSTYQAYNTWGGYSLYRGPAYYGRAIKVSYHRPVEPAELENDFFYGEFPLVRWLERNGYDVSYTSCIDTDRRPAELTKHKVFISSGHDEYWSGGMRANVEAARDAGVNLVFMTGNEVFWRTRWEAASDGTPQRHPGLLQGEPRERQGRPEPGVDGHVARPAVLPAGQRRRRSGELADRDAVPGDQPARRRRFRDRGAGAVRADCAAGATPPWLRWRPARSRCSRRPRSATNGTPTSTTGTGRPGSCGCRRRPKWRRRYCRTTPPRTSRRR